MPLTGCSVSGQDQGPDHNAFPGLLHQLRCASRARAIRRPGVVANSQTVCGGAGVGAPGIRRGLSGGVIVHRVGATVVGLGAWSELARRDRQGMHVDVHEFAVLDDGRRLTLHRDRGFGTSATRLSAGHAESSVLTTVLPDDAEVTGEDHPWEWLASLIREHGVAVTPEQLKAVPYVLEFGPRLSALLGPPASA